MASTISQGVSAHLNQAGLATDVAVEFDVPAVMRDGIVLRANVYRPASGGPWPVLLSRLPYGKDASPGFLGGVLLLDPMQLARRGFVVVIQDTRGRFKSDGEWLPLTFEREDGYDTVEWAATLPGSNGRVGMFGGSYFGYTQWAAAGQRPPSLSAIAPVMCWSDPLDGLFARGGALEWGTVVPWSLRMGANVIDRLNIDEPERVRRREALIDDRDQIVRAYWELPVTANPVLQRHGFPDLGAVRMLDDEQVVERVRVTDDYDSIQVPTFHVTGWYDMCLQGTVDNYMAMVRRGHDARLVIGPWSHDPHGYADPIGEEVFGLRASFFDAPVHDGRDLRAFQLAWFRRHLYPDPTVALPEAPIRLFVMGRNKWRSEYSWPPPDVTIRRYFLSGEGTLGTDPPAAKPPTEFNYDPADPVPTLGGHTHLPPGYAQGACDQSPIESRDDVIVFTSAPLTQELEVTGPVRIIVHAASSAPSTDWVARLCDVHLDGRSINLCDGVVRVTERADTLRRYEIDLWATSTVFFPGHRLRVHITSSSFPRWDRNLNTGNQRVADYRVARQQIFHDDEHPSYLELSVRSAD
jgi:putative CocE/NonD family hydrolase